MCPIAMLNDIFKRKSSKKVLCGYLMCYKSRLLACVYQVLPVCPSDYVLCVCGIPDSRWTRLPGAPLTMCYVFVSSPRLQVDRLPGAPLTMCYVFVSSPRLQVDRFPGVPLTMCYVFVGSPTAGGRGYLVPL